MSRSEAAGQGIRTVQPSFPRLCWLTTSGFTARSERALAGRSDCRLGPGENCFPRLTIRIHRRSAKVNEKIHHEARYALSCQSGRSNRFDPYVFGDDIARRGSKFPQRTGLGTGTAKSL